MIRLTLALFSLFLILGRDDGVGIDPHGGPAGAQVRGTSDRGAGLDPNGLSAQSTGDKGLGVDPNG